MKLRSLFLASLAALAMVSCSNEDDQIVNNEPVNENALMQFGFSYLGTSTTRADVETGLDTEQKFADVVLVLAYDNTAKAIKLERSLFSAVSDPATDGMYYQTAPITVPEGTADVYAVLNAGENTKALTDLDGSTAGKVAIKTAIEALQSSEIAKATITDQFVMYGKSSKEMVKNQTTPVLVQVSRIVAKFKEETTDLTYDVVKNSATGSALNKEIKVSLEGYTFTNLTKKSNLVPGLANITDYLDATVYPNSLDNYGKYKYLDMTNIAVANDKRITYSFENKNAEITNQEGIDGGNITSIIYKANMAVSGFTAGQDIYIYNNIVYKYSELAAVVPGWSQLGFNENTSIAAYEAQGIRRYVGGVCYYRQVIRSGNAGNVLGKAEINRNNVYKLKVTDIAKIGFPTPEHKEDKTMMRLNLEVMPWTINENNFEL